MTIGAMKLSPHFTLAEMTRSQVALRRGIVNAPNPVQIDNLERLAAMILEPIRDILGVPLSVSSGYRNAELNRLVGGARNSAHMQGLAADIVPVGMDLRHAFDLIRATELPYEQLIIECDAWLHVSAPNEGARPRRSTLAASGGPGNWVYTVVA
jgi:zinc D-Ala-D-Ala carboxypeptidase